MSLKLLYFSQLVILLNLNEIDFCGFSKNSRRLGVLFLSILSLFSLNYNASYFLRFV